MSSRPLRSTTLSQRHSLTLPWCRGEAPSLQPLGLPPGPPHAGSDASKSHPVRKYPAVHVVAAQPVAVRVVSVQPVAVRVVSVQLVSVRPVAAACVGG